MNISKDNSGNLPVGIPMCIHKGIPMGVYIHIPLCIRKCLYCDFYSVSGLGEENELRKRLISSICKEIVITGELYKNSIEHKKAVVDTIYFGGGTPSILSEREMNLIMVSLFDSFAVKSGSEISLECNPSTATKEKLDAFRKAGINRISIGAQSFDDGILKVLGRIHDAKSIDVAVKEAGEVGFDNLSLDLMFGIPGQTIEIWEKSIKKAISLEPTHISMYSLEFMEDTPFDKMRQEGLLLETSPDLDRKMYEQGLSLLETAGFYQYEISNVSKPGFQCRHNLKYWDLSEYIGIGPSAHSFVNDIRYSNKSSIQEYIEGINTGIFVTLNDKEPEPEDWPWIDRCHHNSLMDNSSEFMFTGLRKNEGTTYSDFRDRIGEELWSVFPSQKRQLSQFIASGHVIADEKGIRLTSRGMNISNRIMELFV